MIIDDLNVLVQSLSRSERKQIQKSCGEEPLKRSYFKLFQYLIDNPQKRSKELLQDLQIDLPSVQIDSAAQYLMKLISDHLVLCRINQDDWYKQYFGIMKAKLFAERSLENRALTELSKVERLADSQQNYNSLHQAFRMELAIHTAKNFEGLDEQLLVNKQMKIKTVLQHQKQLQDHLSLFELLSYRFSNKNIGNKKDKDLQDLVLNELSLSSRGSKHLFEIQKTHLMFQSFFFIRATEYNAALKIFYKLNVLFEQHPQLWNNPPYDYLSTLDGILDSLRSIRFFDEMNSFLEILEELCRKSYTEHFDQQAELTLLCYKFNRLVSGKAAEQTKLLFKEINSKTSLLQSTSTSIKTIELNFYMALADFLAGNYKDAKKRQRQINEAIFKDQSLLRASRLLSIIIMCDMEESTLLEYEIRSYKRYFSKIGGLLKTEKLIFKFILSEGKNKSKFWKSSYFRNIKASIEQITHEKKEMQINKYYMFTDWLHKHLAN
ncbi:hypothetical protein [Sphingobacterium sp. LRF_L2]|uniref:hypothetical protein n=1 Tax=Sphingobacterium sp. LRF_L2 TaxID=3369421 RepID=UPI003F60E815